MISTRRHIRELALQSLYELDARAGDDSALQQSADAVALSPEDKAAAIELAKTAYAMRDQADQLATEFAPTWPTSRQPAVDRAILRLAWCEMATGRTPPKAAINEAIELAKRFSTDRSPAFINGVLDKMMRRLPQTEEPPGGPQRDTAWPGAEG